MNEATKNVPKNLISTANAFEFIIIYAWYDDIEWQMNTKENLKKKFDPLVY